MKPEHALTISQFPAQKDVFVQERLHHLHEVSQTLLDMARKKGATQAEVSCSESGGLSVNVRLGEVETVEYNQDRGIGVTLYVGKRKGNASTADTSMESLEATIDQALAIAQYTEEDSAAGLPEKEWLAKDAQDFDTWHPWEISADKAIDIALECEDAGRHSSDQIRNSEGASVTSGSGLNVYASSDGFVGASAGTHHSIGAAFIAGEDDAMQRDGWYDFRIDASELSNAKEIGIEAAKRAITRLDPRMIKTGEYPVVFSNEMSRGLLGHLLGAIAGSAQYRRTTFLLDSVGQQILPSWVSITERPFLMRGINSGWFDADGVATQATDLITDGVIQRYLLGTYSARKLGLKPTGNAGGAHNLLVSSNAAGLSELVQEMGTGFLVTQLMGQGVNTVTGDYSRGASGFWVENGEIAYPVDGVTIAGNLKNMLGSIAGIGADHDHRSQHSIGSVYLPKMMVAGE